MLQDKEYKIPKELYNTAMPQFDNIGKFIEFLQEHIHIALDKTMDGCYDDMLEVSIRFDDTVITKYDTYY